MLVAWLAIACETRSLLSAGAVVNMCRRLDGDFSECGVNKGGTAMLLAKVACGSGKKLHLYDSFDGLPEAISEHDYYGQGDFAASYEDVVGYLSDYKDMVCVTKG